MLKGNVEASMIHAIGPNYRRIVFASLMLIMLTSLLTLGFRAEASTSTLTIQSGSTTVGETLSLQIVLSDAPAGFAGYDLILTIANPNVAKFVGADLPAFGLVSKQLISDSEIRLGVVDLMGLVQEGATNVTLGTLTLKGLKKGSTDVHISVVRLEDEGGYPIDADVVSGNVSVGKGVSGNGAKGGGNDKGGNSGSKGKGRNK